jgi:hypothetical protein
MLVLAPLALVVRTIRRWTRGSRVLVRWSEAPFERASGPPIHRIDLELDVPMRAEGTIRLRLTDTVVRIAETLRHGDDSYHMVYRLPELGETVPVAVGPQLQELGDRFALHLGQWALAGRTAVWLTTSRAQVLAEVLDPFRYDPESPGQPDALMATAPIRWGMATESLSSGPSVLHRVLLYVPASATAAVQRLLGDLHG